MEMKVFSKVAEMAVKKKINDTKKLIKARPSVKKQKEDEK